MTSLPEQLSAARNAQLDTQLRVFRNVTSQAFDNASRLWSLNLSVSRDSVERSSRTVRQLIGAPDARGLDVLRTHSEEQMRSLFAYGRALFDLAAGSQAGLQSYALRTLAAAPAPALGAPAAATVREAAFVIDAGNDVTHKALDSAAGVAERAAGTVVDTATEAAADTAAEAATRTVADATTDAAAAVSATVADATSAAADVATDTAADSATESAARVGEPVVVLHDDASPPAGAIDQVLDAPAPAAKPKPLAKAAAKGVPKAAVAPHPMAAPLEDTDTSAVARIETPPPKRRK